MIEPLGVIEVNRHFLAEGLITVCDDVKQVSHRNQVANGQHVTLIDQQLHHHLERGSFALQNAGNGDQRLYQSRAEGIDLAKHLAIAVTRQERRHHGVSNLRRLLERRIQLHARGIAVALQDTPLGDGRQVAVLQRYLVEPAFPMLERVAEVQPVGTGNRVPD